MIDEIASEFELENRLIEQGSISVWERIVNHKKAKKMEKWKHCIKLASRIDEKEFSAMRVNKLFPTAIDDKKEMNLVFHNLRVSKTGDAKEILKSWEEDNGIDCFENHFFEEF